MIEYYNKIIYQIVDVFTLGMPKRFDMNNYKCGI